jgi:hypothetical protein
MGLLIQDKVEEELTARRDRSEELIPPGDMNSSFTSQIFK